MERLLEAIESAGCVAAMTGAFGYELNPAQLSAEEKAAIRRQIARFRRYDALIRGGDYYRLSDPRDAKRLAAWQSVAPDKSETLLSVVVTHPEANPRPLHLRLKGLDPDAMYAADGGARVYSGAALMYGGWTLEALFGDYPSAQLHFQKV